MSNTIFRGNKSHKLFKKKMQTVCHAILRVDSETEVEQVCHVFSFIRSCCAQCSGLVFCQEKKRGLHNFLTSQ